MSKLIKSGEEARKALEAGVNVLADTVFLSLFSFRSGVLLSALEHHVWLIGSHPP